MIDRLYINVGQGRYVKSTQVLPSYTVESTSCVTAADFDRDGDVDLFVGVRLIPYKYGYPGKGYVLQNNGKGFFNRCHVQSSAGPKYRRNDYRCKMV
jgi:hypothetical protein